MEPLVTIIIPFYNAEVFMKHALDSIIIQTHKNLEIICINDGSSDHTSDILEQYRQADNRIIVKTNEKNLGLVATLNDALKLVNGELFARMDADDYSAPERIAKLVAFLNANSSVQLVSSGYRYFNEKGKYSNEVLPIAINYQALKVLSLLVTPLTHAAVCGRTTLIKNKLFYYDPNYLHAEDFELFSRLAWNNVSMANLIEPLYAIRLHLNSVSFKYKALQTATNLEIVKRNLTKYSNFPQVITDEQLKTILCRLTNVISYKELVNAITILEQIMEKETATLHEDIRKEVVLFRNNHLLNIIIQTNKAGFIKKKLAHVVFFLRTLRLIKLEHIKLLLRKVVW